MLHVIACALRYVLHVIACALRYVLHVIACALNAPGSREAAAVELQRTSNEVSDAARAEETSASDAFLPSTGQSQQKYLSLILEAVTGDSEDLRRVCFATDYFSVLSLLFEDFLGNARLTVSAKRV